MKNTFKTLTTFAVAAIIGFSTVSCGKNEKDDSLKSPTNYRVTASSLDGSYGTVTIQWDAVAGAESYILERACTARVHTPPSTTLFNVAINGTTATVTGLFSSTLYDFRIAAVKGTDTARTVTFGAVVLVPTANRETLTVGGPLATTQQRTLIGGTRVTFNVDIPTAGSYRFGLSAPVAESFRFALVTATGGVVEGWRNSLSGTGMVYNTRPLSAGPHAVIVERINTTIPDAQRVYRVAIWQE